MPRARLPLLVALIALGGGETAGASTVTPVTGEIRAMAFSGDGLVVARLPPKGKLVLERIAPGAPTATILTTTSEDNDDELTLAASADALALGLNVNPGDTRGPSQVMIGPARGPLRE